MSWTDPALVADLASEGTTVCRIATMTDWWAERFGDGVIISHTGESVSRDILSGIEGWLAQAGLPNARIYARRLVIGPGQSDKPVLLHGDASLDSHATVSEAGLLYEIDFLAGYSCGLFLDQRANRAHLRSLGAKRVLNTFAYTCSFSVVAAASGAQTLSLDLAKVALERGRRNLALNAIAPDGHRFIADDVQQVLPRLARRGEKFDAIILDPPTFSRAGKSKPFQVERDFPILLEMALACAEPGAWILLSTNCSSLSASALRGIGSRLVRGAKFHSEPPLSDIPASHAASTVWMQVP